MTGFARTPVLPEATSVGALSAECDVHCVVRVVPQTRVLRAILDKNLSDSLSIGPRLAASFASAAIVALWSPSDRQLDRRVMVSCDWVEPLSDGQALGCLCCRPEIQTLTRRINAKLSRRGFVAGAGAAIAGLGLANSARAQVAQPAPQPPIALTNFLLFDGKSGALRGGLSLLIEGGRIKSIATGEPTAAPEGARAIDCGGRVVDPGPDRRALAFGVRSAARFPACFAADVGYIFLAASAEAERTLMRGFTTVRDLGGPVIRRSSRRSTKGFVPGPAHLSVRAP